MKKMMIITLLVLLFVAGCTSYHKVTDLNSGKAYYTTEVKQKNSGAVEIKDGKSGATVTLPSSKVEQISEQEYKQGIYSDD